MEPRVRIHCVCGKTGLVDRKHIGKTITCPKCGIARIKVEDQDDLQTSEDEAEPDDELHLPRMNRRATVPSLAESADVAGTAKAQLWYLKVISLLLAIIAGIMVYNQFGEYVSKAIAEFLRG